MILLRHYGIHFAQRHPLTFLRIFHFELSCAAFAGELLVPLFQRFYHLRSDSVWFTIEKRKENISFPCYSFMPTSTYPKEWKNRFIFVSPSLLSEPLSINDFVATVEDGVSPLSRVEDALWRHMYEHSTCAFNFPEGILALREMSLWNLLQADVRGVSFVVEGVFNQEMGVVLRGEAPNVEGPNVEAVPGDGTPSLEAASPKGLEGSQNSPQVEDISSGDEYLQTWLSRKRKPGPVVGISEAIL
ncbi:hypothetical protein HanOQP8_Chr10g0365761 [Helianthus annuus]|nr:hypothetical protein HanOQP8_Chr10g0365761 [Helianthus annuus]KAJ0883761.1 hypothetical protein HanPSC8_Chr10g0425421 [Helianthus annuus]